MRRAGINNTNEVWDMPEKKEPYISIIIPVFNESKSVRDTYAQITRVLSQGSLDYEIVFVDDGSTDQSLQLLVEIKEKDARVKVVELTRNFGQHPALVAGFASARGKVLITMDADLQVDPEHILPLVDKMEQGYDLVSGVRRGASDSWLKRRLPSRVFNWLIGHVLGKKLQDINCPFNALNQSIVAQFSEYGDMQRYYKPLAVKIARNIAEFDVPISNRNCGQSKYTFFSLVDLFFDFVTNFSKRMFQKIAIAGFFLAGASVFSGLSYLLCRALGILQHPSNQVQVLVLLGFLFGMHLLVLGVLGDFVIKIYKRQEVKPLYKIKKKW